MQIKTVTVIGANGTMGTNVSAIFASFGNAKVYMISRDIEKSKRSIEKAAKSVRADAIKSNLIAADYGELEKCVSESEIVFECVAENLSIKMDVTKKVAMCLKEEAIACSGTSGLSITKLSECFSDEQRKRYFGVHMFNPPYNMTLCELVSTDYSDQMVLSELKKYLSSVLHRTVVYVKDTPAFLGNRIGFQFINEAMLYAEKYKDNGGIDYIDAILGSYTGRAMAPIATSDFVGLDVHKAIVDNIKDNTDDFANDTFIFPNYAKKLINEGKLGRKTGMGLYQMIKHENGTKSLTVYDIKTDTYRDVNRYVFPFAEKMKEDIRNGDYQDAFNELVSNKSQEAEICRHFLMMYIVYSLSSVRKVAFDISAIDDVMATGYNWCPPLAMIHALSSVCDVEKLAEETLGETISINAKIEELFKEVVPSKYDYRIYFKSGK